MQKVNPKFNYPDSSTPDVHMITVKRKTERPFDSTYDFINDGFFFNVFRYFMSFIARTIGGLLVKIILGSKVKGKKNIRKNRHLLKNGAVSVCNHIHIYDTIVIMSSLKRHAIRYPAWEENLRGKNRFLIRFTGGIPVPANARGLVKMKQAFDEILSRKKWVHFFPEGSMWWYYKPIRPFKKGAFKFAVRNNVPIIPMAFSFKRTRGLYRLFKPNAFQPILNIGEPILPPQDENMSEYDKVEQMRDLAYRSCCNLASTTPHVL